MKQITLILSFLLLLLSLFSQDFDFQLKQPKTLYIGTPIQMEMQLITAPNDSIFVPQIDTLDIFVLKPPVTSQEEIINSEKKTTLLFTFLPFDTGEHVFPEMEVSVRTEEELKTFRTVEIPLVIESVLTDSLSGLRDIAEPIHLRLGIWDYALIVFALAFLIALIYVLKKWLRKQPVLPEKSIITDDRPAYQKALELLEQTKKKKLLENGKFLLYHFELSYILRFFLENEYKINAMEMTTSEIREHLVLQNAKEKSEILAFLNFADQIKFAKFIPEYEDSKSALQWLEHYLLSFTTKEENKNA